MPKLTDDEVGTLLRETFADKEKLIDQLPKATTSPVRRKAPALLAAAAVLAVLAGTVAIAGDNGRPPVAGNEAHQPLSSTEPAERTQSAPAKTFSAQAAGVSPHPQIIALAIAEIAKRERPTDGWPVVKVLDAPYAAAGSPTGPGAAGTPFTAPERAQIAALTGLPIEWVKERKTGPKVCDQQPSPAPYITVGRLVYEKGAAGATIGMSVWRGCLDAQWLTYRLGRIPATDKWRVTDTVGPVAMS